MCYGMFFFFSSCHVYLEIYVLVSVSRHAVIAFDHGAPSQISAVNLTIEVDDVNDNAPFCIEPITTVCFICGTKLRRQFFKKKKNTCNPNTHSF